MKPLLLMFVASALIAQVPTQTVSIQAVPVMLRAGADIAESYRYIFPEGSEGDAYLRGFRDAKRDDANIVERIVGPAYEPALGLTAEIER